MKPEFKYHIDNTLGIFTIRLGFDWDAGQVGFYIPLDKTCYADYCPLPKFRFNSAEEAQRYLRILQDWLERLFAARPNSAKWIKTH